MVRGAYMNKNKKIALFGIIFIILFSVLWIIALYSVTQSVSDVETRIKSLESELDAADNELNIVNSKISNVNDNINQISANLDENISELEKLQSGSRYQLKNPTYLEAAHFINQDQTNTKPYDNKTFNCVHYAREVNNNAEDQGIRCAYVVVILSGPANHACVTFNTTDEGIIYYEPQTDTRFIPKIGKDYWADCVSIKSGYYYPPDPNNKIEGLTVYW
jgi:uncharacterized protein YoxC